MAKTSKPLDSKSIKKTEDQSSHPLILKASDRITPLLKELWPTFLGNGLKLTSLPKLSLEQKYHFSVLQYATTLADIPNQMQLCQTFINKIPTISVLSRLGISRKAYIIYHYRIYIMLLHTAYDVALNLCNATLHLGIGKGQVREQIILGNKWVHGTGIVKSIGRIKDVGVGQTRIRNHILHHGTDPEINGLEQEFYFEDMYTFAQQAGIAIESDQKALDELIRSRLYRVTGPIVREQKALV